MKLQDTAKKLDTIGAKQRDLRKQLYDHDMKDVPPAKKMKLELFLLMMKTMNNAIDIFCNQFQCICTSSLSAAFNQDAVYSIFIGPTLFYKS